LIRQAASGLRFGRRNWQAVVAECLIHGAASMPRLEVAPASMCCLLAPEWLTTNLGRTESSPIEQVHYGSHDLRLGGAIYRPDHVGWNDAAAVARLTEFMQAIEPAAWTADNLARLPEFADAAERDEELAFVRDWWPALVALYADARCTDQIIVCEHP
jgi:hypothetical protein